MPEKGRFPAVLTPIWSKCELCENYWCNIHGMHVADCDCPPVEDFTECSTYPYDASLLRYLTPLECERLQGFPDNWTVCNIDDIEISDMQRYKKIGNAVTVNVAEWIGKRIMEVDKL
jgi:site-specific DNA-cytosine methylase